MKRSNAHLKEEERPMRSAQKGGFNDCQLFPLQDVSVAPEYAKRAAMAVGQLIRVTPGRAKIGAIKGGSQLLIPAIKLRHCVFIDGYPLWQDTRSDIASFFDEYTIEASTATLVGRDLILAAGHAVAERDIISGNTFFIPERTTARCTMARPSMGLNVRVPSNEYFRVKTICALVNRDLHNDWAILKLEREVPDTRQPIPVMSHEDLEENAKLDLFTLTHPLGLPLKYTEALDASSGSTFEQVYCDFGSGSSGAPLLLHADGHTRILGAIAGNARFTVRNRRKTKSGFTVDPLQGAGKLGAKQPVTISANIDWPSKL